MGGENETRSGKKEIGMGWQQTLNMKNTENKNVISSNLFGLILPSIRFRPSLGAHPKHVVGRHNTW